MTHIERMQAVLAGRRPDRPPVSFWYHFPPDQVSGAAAVSAHMRHLDKWNLDFLKVMNDNGYPHEGAIRTVNDLASLKELRGDEDAFARQLEVLGALKKALAGRVWMTTTIFNAWAVLRHLVRPPTAHNPPDLDAAADVPSRQIKSFINEDRGAVERALLAIGRSLANFARRCLDAGADGIFLSVRDDWVDAPGQPPLYEQLVRPTDLEILSAASAGRFNMLHICGKAVSFAKLAEYPVHVLNWADRAAGPSIAQVKDWVKPAICAGVDNLGTLVNGTPEDVRREVADAIAQAGGRPIMIAPGCTFDPTRVREDNLRALAPSA